MPRYYKKRKRNYIARRTMYNRIFKKNARAKYTRAINKGLKKKLPVGVRSLIKGYAGIRTYRPRFIARGKPRRYSTMRNRIRERVRTATARRNYLNNPNRPLRRRPFAENSYEVANLDNRRTATLARLNRAYRQSRFRRGLGAGGRFNRLRNLDRVQQNIHRNTQPLIRASSARQRFLEKRAGAARFIIF